MRTKRSARIAALFACCAVVSLGGCSAVRPKLANKPTAQPRAERVVEQVMQQDVQQVMQQDVQLVQATSELPPNPSYGAPVVTQAAPQGSDAEIAAEQSPATTSGQQLLVTTAQPIAVNLGAPVVTEPSVPIEHFPIDLPTALRLAGANNLQIRLASERVREAQAQTRAAEAQWLPSLNAAIGYNKHVGRIQDTRGDVIDVSRSSLYTGAGAVVDNAPLTGASGGPARMFVDLSLSDAYFGPLAARQAAQAVGARRSATFNNVLLDVSLAYQQLLRAQSQQSIALEAVENANELVRLTTTRVEARMGLPVDAQRAKTELASREVEQLKVEERIGVASAELARLLRLEPSVSLLVFEVTPVPIDLIDAETPVEELIGQAVSMRPEMAEARARICETCARVRQEHWRPYLPNVHAGVSSGGFGGGRGSTIQSFSDRTDLDLLAVWQLQNLGLGNQALRDQARSRNRQAFVAQSLVRDQIAAEVATAQHRVRSRKQQIEVAQRRVDAAAEALPLNFKGIKGDQLRAIEAQQAIEALASARTAYLESVIGYNEAQFELLRAVGDLPHLGE